MLHSDLSQLRAHWLQSYKKIWAHDDMVGAYCPQPYVSLQIGLPPNQPKLAMLFVLRIFGNLAILKPFLFFKAKRTEAFPQTQL